MNTESVITMSNRTRGALGACLLFLAGLAANSSCGNGVPVEAAPSGGGTTCATNDDCDPGDICVRQACVKLGESTMETDGGSTVETLYCDGCQADTDCGGEGNYCLTARGGGAKFCGTKCQADSECETGARCFVFSGRSERNCYPVNGSCEPGVDGGTTTTDAGHPDAGTPDAGAPDAGGACTTDTWGNFAENLLVTECLACHTHTHHFSDSYSSVNSNRSSIRRDIANGSMPKSPQSITSTEKSRIIKWIDCGLPQ